MRLIFALVTIWTLPVLVWAEALTVLNVEYTLSEKIPSCTLLKHRAIERDKVLRELPNYDLKANYLMINKFFMDQKVWFDETIDVHLEIQIPGNMAQHMDQYGLQKTFLVLSGPGVVWHSYANQFPEDAKLVYYADRQILHLSYKIYQNEYCFGTLEVPQVEWIPRN